MGAGGFVAVEEDEGVAVGGLTEDDDDDAAVVGLEEEEVGVDEEGPPFAAVPFAALLLLLLLPLPLPLLLPFLAPPDDDDPGCRPRYSFVICTRVDSSSCSAMSSALLGSSWRERLTWASWSSRLMWDGWWKEKKWVSQRVGHRTPYIVAVTSTATPTWYSYCSSSSRSMVLCWVSGWSGLECERSLGVGSEWESVREDSRMLEYPGPKSPHSPTPPARPRVRSGSCDTCHRPRCAPVATLLA